MHRKAFLRIISFLLPVLCASWLLNGCYAYSSWTPDYQKDPYPPDDETLRITLNDGSIIRSASGRHIVLQSPSDILFGVAEKGIPKGWASESFNVLYRFDRAEIESMHTSDAGLTCSLKQGATLTFPRGSYLLITPDQGTGLWCLGSREDSVSREAFAGKVERSSIRRIELQYFDTGTVVTWILLGLAAVVMAIILFEVIVAPQIPFN